MINKSPTNLDKFPVPVTGQEIPKGWFARLVSYINSLVLHGDGQYLAVSHNMSGTTIKPTPALLQLASGRGAAPSSGGGSTAFVPDYAHPTAMAPETTCGPFTYPVWIVGYISAYFVNTANFEAYLTLSNPTVSFLFIDFALNQTQATKISTPITLLVPSSTQFTLHTITTEPNDLTIALNYYPCL